MRRALGAVLLTALCLGTTACGFEPMDVPNNSGMKPGPGLLTGKEGEFVIHDGKGRAPPPPAPPG